MYNHYARGQFSPVEEDSFHFTESSRPNKAAARPEQPKGTLSQLLGKLTALFRANRFDSGDLLLILIILFLLQEGDNTELILTLGLMLILGLGEEPRELVTNSLLITVCNHSRSKYGDTLVCYCLGFEMCIKCFLKECHFCFLIRIRGLE